MSQSEGTISVEELCHCCGYAAGDIKECSGCGFATASGTSTPEPSEEDPNVKAARQDLESHLATRVKFTPHGKGGRIEISYSDDDDLMRIYEMLVPKEAL